MNQNKALELTKDIATDIIGGILIAVGVYNFAAAAKFPMVGVNGIALIDLLPVVWTADRYCCPDP